MGLHATHAAHGAVRAGAHWELRKKKGTNPKSATKPPCASAMALVAPSLPQPCLWNGARGGMHPPLRLWGGHGIINHGVPSWKGPQGSTFLGKSMVQLHLNKQNPDRPTTTQRAPSNQHLTLLYPPQQSCHHLGRSGRTAALLTGIRNEQSHPRVNRFLMVCFIPVL